MPARTFGVIKLGLFCYGPETHYPEFHWNLIRGVLSRNWILAGRYSGDFLPRRKTARLFCNIMRHLYIRNIPLFCGEKWKKEKEKRGALASGARIRQGGITAFCNRAIDNARIRQKPTIRPAADVTYKSRSRPTFSTHFSRRYTRQRRSKLPRKNGHSPHYARSMKNSAENYRAKMRSLDADWIQRLQLSATVNYGNAKFMSCNESLFLKQRQSWEIRNEFSVK